METSHARFAICNAAFKSAFGRRDAALTRGESKPAGTRSKVCPVASLMVHRRTIAYTVCLHGLAASRRTALLERIICAFHATADLKAPRMMVVAALRERAW
jgi:hypothetical protein